MKIEERFYKYQYRKFNEVEWKFCDVYWYKYCRDSPSYDVRLTESLMRGM